MGTVGSIKTKFGIVGVPEKMKKVEGGDGEVVWGGYEEWVGEARRWL